jgi:hypothetical protein
MSKLLKKPVILIGVSVIFALIIGLIEVIFKEQSDATLLLTLTFWVALIQGSVAVVAAAEAAMGKWIEPLKKELLSFYPLILLLSFLFLLLYPQMDIYKWSEDSHQWLNINFFIIRNFMVLLLSFIVAHLFARASLKNRPSKGYLAILYLFIYVLSQSLVAFDWIMSLEFPWMSTMFAPIFFMESFYGGLALLGIITAFMIKNKERSKEETLKVLRDSATFMFGFALAWAGLYYGQYLVIWYGNIPWETSFFGSRMAHSPYREMLTLTIIIFFVIPFIMFIPKRVKSSPLYVSIISFFVFIGLIIERIYYINPVVSISYSWVAVEFLLIGFLMILLLRSQDYKFIRLNRSIN